MDPTDQRAAAAAAFNRCWDLLEIESLESDQAADLLTAAFVSRHHWQQVGGLEQTVVADWMVSRAAAVTGHGRLAVEFAERANDAVDGTLEDWVAASTAEGLARAYAAEGDAGLREEWRVRAASLVEQIADAESRELIAEQLATVPR